MKVVAIAIGMVLSACSSDPFVGTWMLAQSPHAATPDGCPATSKETFVLRVDATGSPDVHTIAVEGQSPYQVPLYEGSLRFDALMPTNRADVGAAGYVLEPGGDGLIGTGSWEYLVGDAAHDPAGPCPGLDVRSR